MHLFGLCLDNSNALVLMTEWGDLDYLIVDLPPGTSDGPLTVLQTLNLDGFVIVTAPQDISKLFQNVFLN